MGEAIKTLLVDDHKIVRDGIRSILSSDKGIEVVAEAKDGTAAIEKLEQLNGEIDVVVLDINMPGLSGVDATEIITKLYPDVRILGLTMHSEKTYILNMIKAGALGYVLKDSGGQKLIEAVKTVAVGKNYYSNEVSVALVRGLVNEGNSSDNSYGLSEREIQILQVVSEGYSNAEIGTQQNLSSRTIETHRRNIMKKMGVRNTAEMIAVAIKKGLVE